IRDFHLTGVQTCALPICVILRRQSGDQVQMLDDLPALPEGAHGAGQFFKVLPPLDQFVGEGIGRLNADLEAENARRRVFVQKTEDRKSVEKGMSADRDSW